MKCQQKQQAILLSLAATVMLLCISCHGKTQSNEQRVAQETFVDKCPISIPSLTQCTLSQMNDERVVWINNSGANLYVCFDPRNGPFEAYAWSVPDQGRRRSGRIRDDINPPQAYEFYYSTSPCVWPPPGVHTETNPKIIIKQ